MTKKAAPKRERLDVETFLPQSEPYRSDVVQANPDAIAYAVRVWSGQSVDLPTKERLSRVIRALEGQNLPTEGIDVSTIEAAL